MTSGIRLAARALGRHRSRSFLMMLGVAIGISSLTALYSVGENTRQETSRRFKNMLGTFDTVMVRPGSGRTRGMPSLTNVEPTLKFDDALAIETGVPEIKRVARLQSAFDIDVKYKDRATATAVFGASPNWLDLRGDEVAEGEFLSDEDERMLARVAVIGTDVRSVLFADENPGGKTLRIADVPFQVKGVLKPRGAGPTGASLDNVIMIPVATASRRLFNRDFLTMVVAQLNDPLQSETAIFNVRALLRQRHHLAPSALDDFTITSPQAITAQVTRVGTTLARTLMGVAGIAVFVGGIVIMSLMLIAVSERRKEIGVRRSFGASRNDILLQFMLESVVISVVGGFLGLIVSVAGTNLAAAFQNMAPVFAWNALGLAALLSIGTGVLFGFYPAWKAARLDPVFALRS